MKNKIRTFAICGGILAAAGLNTSVQAAISEAENNGITWLGTPTYLVAAGATAASFTVAENNYNAGGAGGAGGFGALSQSFTLSSGQAGTLSSIQLVLSGSANTFDVELIDLGAYPVSGYPATSASYNPTSLGSILSAGAKFTYAGTAGNNANVVQLTFSGADAVNLNAGELYAFQIDPTTAPATQTVWFRANLGGLGQEYRMNQFTSGSGVMGALNGATRDASFALTIAPAPEPTTLALAGLGGLASLVALRRKK
jgi:hypothetical protein